MDHGRTVRTGGKMKASLLPPVARRGAWVGAGRVQRRVKSEEEISTFVALCAQMSGPRIVGERWKAHASKSSNRTEDKEFNGANQFVPSLTSRFSRTRSGDKVIHPSKPSRTAAIRPVPTIRTGAIFHRLQAL